MGLQPSASNENGRVIFVLYFNINLS